MTLTKQQIERFISLGYATDALKFARYDCRQLKLIKDSASMAWQSRVTSLVTHYARPFKHAKGMSSLDTKVIPDDYRELHAKLIQARDKAHAHLDADLSFNSEKSPVHRIYLLKQKDGSHHWISTRILLLERSDIALIESLIEALLAHLDIESDSLEKLFQSSINALTPGLHTLSSAAPHFSKDVDHQRVTKLTDLKIIN